MKSKKISLSIAAFIYAYISGNYRNIGIFYNKRTAWSRPYRSLIYLFF